MNDINLGSFDFSQFSGVASNTVSFSTGMSIPAKSLIMSASGYMPSPFNGAGQSYVTVSIGVSAGDASIFQFDGGTGSSSTPGNDLFVPPLSETADVLVVVTFEIDPGLSLKDLTSGSIDRLNVIYHTLS
jgi:hypothetical protein